MENIIILKTNRLTITPMTLKELKYMINFAVNVELKSAFTEMLENCKKNQSDLIWYIPWKIVLNMNNKEIGSLGFKGKNKDKSAELGYGINSDYQNKGFATEAVSSIIKWAFSQDDVLSIKAEIDKNNIASKKVLKKNKFVESGIGSEGPIFILKNN